MLADCTSASVPLSRVVRGHPRGLLQSPSGLSDALIAPRIQATEFQPLTPFFISFSSSDLIASVLSGSERAVKRPSLPWLRPITVHEMK